MNTMKTFFLMALLTVLLVAIGSWIGGQTGMVLAFLFAVVMNFGTYWFSDAIVLRMYGAKELSQGENPGLFQIIQNLAARAGLPMPRVYMIRGEQPNAFATGRNPAHAAVAVTEGILHTLSTDELRGVLAHELAHVKHRDILIGSVAATIAATIMMVARMAQYAAMFGGASSRDDDRGGNPISLLLMVILAPLAAMLIQAAISRSREFAADAGGAGIAGTPYGLVNALKKLEVASKQVPLDANPATSHMFIIKPFSVGGLLAIFSTHPPTEQRIRALLNTA